MNTPAASAHTRLVSSANMASTSAVNASAKKLLISDLSRYGVWNHPPLGLERLTFYAAPLDSLWGLCFRKSSGTGRVSFPHCKELRMVD